MTDLPLTSATVLRHDHRLALPGLPLRSWGRALRNLLGWLLGAVWLAVASSAATVRGARSAILVGAGFSCVPVATYGLVGVWWAVLTAAPMLVLFDYLLGD